jgi:hypothetical protein
MLAIACSRQPAISMPDTAPGWNRTGQVRTFSAKKLYEYMDGEADKYVQAGVKQTITANYRHRSGLEAVADVFVMSAGLGPIQLFGAEPGTDTHGVGLGEAARVYASSLTFRKGRYLVRVVAFAEGPRVSVQLEDLAKAIDQQLK